MCLKGKGKLQKFSSLCLLEENLPSVSGPLKLGELYWLFNYFVLFIYLFILFIYLFIYFFCELKKY